MKYQKYFFILLNDANEQFQKIVMDFKKFQKNKAHNIIKFQA